MKELNDEFYQHLLMAYSERTARKHTMVVDLFKEGEDL